LDVVEWAIKGVSLGAGEILLTSIDREGTKKGFDIELVKAVTDAVNVPVIASGGMGKIEDAALVIQSGHADAFAMADIIHYKRSKINDVRMYLRNMGIHVRNYNE
jgi:imidazole glycerol-phosphate synthase subunit HisF